MQWSKSIIHAAADRRGGGRAARVRRGGGGASAQTAAAHGGVRGGAQRTAVREGHEDDARGGLRALSAPHGALPRGAGAARARRSERALPARVWRRGP